jgi:hypothetical protein
LLFQHRSLHAVATPQAVKLLSKSTRTSLHLNISTANDLPFCSFRGLSLHIGGAMLVADRLLWRSWTKASWRTDKSGENPSSDSADVLMCS